MPVPAPYPDLNELLDLIGEAGRRISEIDASEGAAGNISVYAGWEIDPRRIFPVEQTIPLPVDMSGLSEGVFIVTGSGRRLREVLQDPAANLGVVRVNPEGKTAQLYTSPRRLFANLTSEFNSHLSVHHDLILETGTNFNTLIHAQPPNLTYLSHIPRYQNQAYLNQHLLRWQPELIVNLPEGVGYVPFAVPGSQGLMEATVASLRAHRIVLWEKHGVMAKSDTSVKRAADRIEYAETAADYEYRNLLIGEPGEGLSKEQIRQICSAFHIDQTIF